MSAVVESKVATPAATQAKRTVKFSIYRYDPDKDAKPYMQDLEVELFPTDKMLLDALMRIKQSTDDSLAFQDRESRLTQLFATYFTETFHPINPCISCASTLTSWSAQIND